LIFDKFFGKNIWIFGLFYIYTCDKLKNGILFYPVKFFIQGDGKKIIFIMMFEHENVGNKIKK
jgi:hypothetical protein